MESCARFDGGLIYIFGGKNSLKERDEEIYRFWELLAEKLPFTFVDESALDEALGAPDKLVVLLSDLPLRSAGKFVEFLKNGGGAFTISPLPFLNYLDDYGKRIERRDLFHEITALGGWYDFQEARLSEPTPQGIQHGFFFGITNWSASFSMDDFRINHELVPLLASRGGSVSAFKRKIGKGFIIHAGFPYFTTFEFVLNVYSALSLLLGKDTPEFVEKARRDFASALDEFIARGVSSIFGVQPEGWLPAPGKVYFLTHSHLDFSWLWNYHRTIEKMKLTSIRALKNILLFGEKGFKMNMTSPAFYWFMENYAPSVFKEILQNIKNGQWDPVTGDWVEHDCNVTSGESLVRQRLHGQRYLRSRFGISSSISWMPDTFGFPVQLPQIMKKSGQKYFFTNKLDWGDQYKLPLRIFEWVSPDGSSVIACNLPPGWGCAAFAPFHASTFREFARGSELDSGKILVSSSDFPLSESPENYVDIYPVLVGEGDGGAGPSEDLVRAALKYIENSSVVEGFFTAREFFHALEEKISSGGASPVKWADELYLPCHRGTYTSQWWIKSLNRRGETALFETEFLSLVLSYFAKERYPQERIDRAWKELLLYQFHDPLPGSGIREVYKEAREIIPRFVFSLKEDVIRKFSMISSGGAVRKLVFNPSPYEGKFYVEKSCGGVSLLSLTAGGFSEVPRGSSSGALEYRVPERASIENRFYRVEVSDGALESIKSLEDGIELLKEPVRIVAYSDKPVYWDNWEISPDYLEHPKAYFVASEIILREVASYSAVVMRGELAGSPFTWEIRLFRDLPFIENRLWTDWKSSRTLVKMWVNTIFSGKEVVASTQFGHYKRPFEPRSEYEKSKWEYPHQEWESIFNGKGAFHVINDSLYGSGIKDGRYGLTLIKAGNSPDPEADIYEHNWKIIFTHNMGDWKIGKPWVLSSFVNMPPFVMDVSAELAGRLLGKSILQISDNIVLSAFKKWEDGEGIVIRIFSPLGSEEEGILKLGLMREIKEVKELNFIEDIIDESPRGVDVEGNSLKILLAPWEIRTFLLK